MLASMPDKKEFELCVKESKDVLAREETQTSRLFVVDAGLDAASLGAKNADSSRYAIVRGRITPTYSSGMRQPPHWRGYVTAIDNYEINAPLEMRRVFARSGASGGMRFEATVAFGKRHEPWITSTSILP